MQSKRLCKKYPTRLKRKTEIHSVPLICDKVHAGQLGVQLAGPQCSRPEVDPDQPVPCHVGVGLGLHPGRLQIRRVGGGRWRRPVHHHGRLQGRTREEDAQGGGWRWWLRGYGHGRVRWYGVGDGWLKAE